MLPLLLMAILTMPQGQDPGSQQTQPKAQPQIGMRAETDQTVNVQKGMRVDLQNFAGDVIVKTWERDAVRVRARHSSRSKIDITPRDQVLRISHEGMYSVDYELTVPAWIALKVECQEGDVDIDGLAGGATINTTEGDIILRNLGGPASVESIEGDILIEGGRGRIQVKTTDGDITVSKASGELLLESIDGTIKLTDVTATALEASTVDGDILFSGTFQGSGRYRFESHDGDVTLMIPETTSATFTIRRYDSSRKLDSTLPLKPVGDTSRARRATYTLGGGAAQVEIESFDGDVVIKKR
jgi:DUF4097 and DUF4098 domain-containing protein YvlB